MITINFFGEPSAGKSTAMLGLTYMMKMLGLSAENTPEFYKELILEDGQHAKFGGQLAILSEQNKRLARLDGKNDFTITDCPLPLIGFYTKDDYVTGFHEFTNNLFNNYNNVNYFIIRNHEFENVKRDHNEEEAKKIAIELPIYLEKTGVSYKKIQSGDDLVERVLQDLIKNNIITNEQLLKARNQKGRDLAKKQINKIKY